MKSSTFVVFMAVAACFTGCASGNPAPLYDAEANRTLPCPDALAKPGSQAKIRLPSGDSLLLIWRTEIGFGATDLRCTHCGHDLVFHAERATLECPMGIKFRLDGSFLDGYVNERETVRPLRAYLVDFDGKRLKILG